MPWILSGGRPGVVINKVQPGRLVEPYFPARRQSPEHPLIAIADVAECQVFLGSATELCASCLVLNVVVDGVRNALEPEFKVALVQ